MQDGSRLGAARRQLRSARYAVGIAAGIAFAGIALLARVAHPGVSHASAGGQTAAPATAQQTAGGFFAGGSAIAPAQSSVPQVRSGGS